MLRKLLKYDLAWCFKPLSVFYLLALFFSIVTRIIESLDQSLLLVIIDKICSGIVIAMIANILINCFMRNWVRFIRNIYRDESYLTHTLPVSKHQIFLSKVLTMIITLLASFAVIILCLAIVALNEDTWLFLKNAFEQSAVFFDSSVFGLVLTMAMMIFCQFLFIMMSGVLGIIIGHRSNNLKIVKSIVFGFILYFGLSALSVGIVYLSSLFNPDIASIFSSLSVSSSVLKTVTLIITAAYALYNLALYFIGDRLLNKGVNVD